MNWKPIDSAPKDGRLLLLLIKPDLEHPDITEDVDDGLSRTIGHNSLENTGEDEWQFAGWCWDHDCYTEGHGTPLFWRDFPESIT